MKAILKFFLKSFVILTSAYGLPTVIFLAIFKEELNFENVMISSVSFGLFFSLVLIVIYLINLNHRGIANLKDEDFSTKQKKMIQANLTKEELVKRLQNSRWKRNVQVNENGHTISLSDSLSWWSFGENVSIHITSANNGVNNFEISSKPKIWTTLVDYGKNQNNVLEIERIILA